MRANMAINKDIGLFQSLPNQEKFLSVALS